MDIFEKLFKEKFELMTKKRAIYKLLNDPKQCEEMNLTSLDLFLLDSQMNIIESYIQILNARILTIESKDND